MSCGAGRRTDAEDEKGCLYNTNKLKNHLLTFRKDEILLLLKFHGLQISPFTPQLGSGCLKTLKQELENDLKEMLIDAEGCRDFVLPPDTPPNEEPVHQKDIS